MRLRAALFVQPVLVLAVLAGACGGSGESARETTLSAPADPSDSSSDGAASPSCSAECRAKIRADREARDTARCRALLSKVSLTFRITTTAAPTGTEISLHMILVNQSSTTLSGTTGGLLKVSPEPRSNQINWGGSSADELGQRPATTLRRQIWHDRKPPGWHPLGDRVTSFDYYAIAYAPGKGLVACDIPATVAAPPGLVDGQPSGRWTQQPNP